MTPSITSVSRINASRCIVVWVLRAVAVILLATGTYLMLKRIAFGLGTLNFEAAFQAWTGVGEGHSLYRGIGMVLVGMAMGCFSGRIARWIITMPATGCPGCGYAVQESEGGSGGQPRCSECGLLLDSGVDGIGPGGATVGE